MRYAAVVLGLAGVANAHQLYKWLSFVVSAGTDPKSRTLIPTLTSHAASGPHSRPMIDCLRDYLR